MTARASVLPAALLRAGLLAAVMAIVAGIFGMHVMTADHSSHAAHAGAAVAAGDAAVGHAPAGHTAAEHAAVDHSAGHTAVEHSDAGHAAVLADAVGAAGAAFTASESCSAGCPDVREGGASCTPLAAFTASESCSAGCPDVREGGASCTPLAKTGSLAAVPPPANPTALLAPASGAHGTTGYSFVPPSKTPCELSISRT